ncbi:hypothetical protein RRG08_054039 [Elysia crispata]|uniref:Uncharacterized protein n=1 Tax=Elysia crispata TaxID=231223 RepID=A0AAE0ZA34_9GAST|nr:hypothetical protein RRG08_054039 [Elysia crispata]
MFLAAPHTTSSSGSLVLRLSKQDFHNPQAAALDAKRYIKLGTSCAKSNTERHAHQSSPDIPLLLPIREGPEKNLHVPKITKVKYRIKERSTDIGSPNPLSIRFSRNPRELNPIQEFHKSKLDSVIQRGKSIVLFDVWHFSCYTYHALFRVSSKCDSPDNVRTAIVTQIQYKPSSIWCVKSHPDPVQAAFNLVCKVSPRSSTSRLQSVCNVCHTLLLSTYSAAFNLVCNVCHTLLLSTYSAAFNLVCNVCHTLLLSTYSAVFNLVCSVCHTLLLSTYSAVFNLVCNVCHTLLLLTYSAAFSLVCNVCHTLLLSTYSAAFNLVCNVCHTLLLSTYSAAFNLLCNVCHTLLLSTYSAVFNLVCNVCHTLLLSTYSAAFNLVCNVCHTLLLSTYSAAFNLVCNVCHTLLLSTYSAAFNLVCNVCHTLLLSTYSALTSEMQPLSLFLLLQVMASLSISFVIDVAVDVILAAPIDAADVAEVFLVMCLLMISQSMCMLLLLISRANCAVTDFLNNILTVVRGVFTLLRLVGSEPVHYISNCVLLIH